MLIKRLSVILIFFFIKNFILSAQVLSSAHLNLITFNNKQLNYLPDKTYLNTPPQNSDGNFKIRKQGFGTIIGLQRGAITNIVLGGEYHWKKMRFTRPKLWAANFSFEYNFGHNIAGYRAGFFYKVGKIALTYGASACYITDFDKGSFGVTPTLGFRLAGFHFTTGYNILTDNPPEKKYNTLFVGLVYYFPVFSHTRILKSKKKHKDNFFKRVFKKKEKEDEDEKD